MAYHRRPKTTAEKRANQDREWNRGKRSVRRLPSNWDDLHRSSLEDRSWKKYRKTKWKS